MITRQVLVKIKSRALRMRVWFRTLSKAERAIIDLTIKCVEKVQSPTLEDSLTTIIHKMFGALENRFLAKAEKIGRQLAQNLSNVAQRWGNKTASNWEYNKNFIIYLGVNSLD